MNESVFLTAVLDLAEIHSVLAFHVFDSRYAIGKGFPDLVLVGRHRTMFAELKTQRGRWSQMQVTWKYRLIASGEHWVSWTPADLDNGAIADTLSEL